MLTPVTTIINLPGGIRRTTTTRTLTVVLLPFMRSRKVYFKIEGLLPNLEHTPYFANVDVSDWCREEAFQLMSDVDADLEDEDSASLSAHPSGSSALISDGDGVITGTFFIPNTSALRFRAGRREFKVRDAAATTDASSISKAFAAYTAQGTLETRETTITTILPPPPELPVTVRRIDPLAQSFVIERQTGAFVTSVDIFMATKSATVPLQVQIRPMENGLPTGSPVPGAVKFVLPADVNAHASPSTATDASITNVAFDVPIYLNGFTEYALVLLAESDDYTAWTAATEEYVVGSTTKRIMKQPSLGSLFKSQNGTTWTPDQSRDMMFRIKRAAFGAGSTGTAYFEQAALRRKPITLIEVLNIQASPTVRVYHENHGMFTDSSVTLSGLTTNHGIADTYLNTTHVIVDGDDADSYTITATGGTSTTSGTSVQTGKATQNHTFDLMFPNVNQMILSGAVAQWAVKTTTGQSIAGDETPYAKSASYEAVSVNDNIEFINPRTVGSTINESVNMSAEKSLAFEASLSTTSDLISPVIDLSRLSASLIGNRIDRQSATPDLDGYNEPANFVSETDPISGSSLAKHVFRAITLEQAAVGIKMLMAANRPSGSYIDVYYKAIASGSDAPLSQTDWTLAVIDQAIQTDDDPNVFREYVYTIDSLDDFNTFQIKIVFTSSNTSSVPRIKDFRAIALST